MVAEPSGSSGGSHGECQLGGVMRMFQNCIMRWGWCPACEHTENHGLAAVSGSVPRYTERISTGLLTSSAFAYSAD